MSLKNYWKGKRSSETYDIIAGIFELNFQKTLKPKTDPKKSFQAFNSTVKYGSTKKKLRCHKNYENRTEWIKNNVIEYYEKDRILLKRY